ncbi:MAG TPA: hypothetical protein VK779_10040 [Rhizomicrobium sp.]|nr:hypothetical protein [Rhizomicrobium sp.]
MAVTSSLRAQGDACATVSKKIASAQTLAPIFPPMADSPFLVFGIDLNSANFQAPHFVGKKLSKRLKTHGNVA